MGELIFLDSNIIIFANIENIPEHAKSLTLLENTIKGNVEGCINTIVAIESHYKLLKLFDASEAKYRIDSLLNSSKLKFFNINKNTLKEAFKIVEENKMKTNDAIIIASMLENDINTIYTDNEKDFKKYPKIKVINPFG